MGLNSHLLRWNEGLPSCCLCFPLFDAGVLGHALCSCIVCRFSRCAPNQVNSHQVEPEHLFLHTWKNDSSSHNIMFSPWLPCLGRQFCQLRHKCHPSTGGSLRWEIGPYTWGWAVSLTDSDNMFWAGSDPAGGRAVITAYPSWARSWRCGNSWVKSGSVGIRICRKRKEEKWISRKRKED